MGSSSRFRRALLCVLAAAAVGAAAGSAAAAFPGANGRLLYIRLPPITDDDLYSGVVRRALWTIEADGTGARRVTASVGEEARWSPDGTLIAYSSDCRSRYTTYCGDIYVTNPTTGEGDLVVGGSGTGPPLEFTPAWSPDGGRLVFGRLDGLTGLAVRDLGSGAETQLSEGYSRSPAWSPDGTTIAFKRGKAIYLVDPDGADLRVLASGAAPDWSPDGTMLAYVRYDRVCLLTLATGQRRCLLRGVSPAWSPDGRLLAFSRDGDLFVARADGTGVRRLTRTPTFYETAPDWQPRPPAG